MAIPWLTVLQTIPWGQVIENTPKLVDGAQKLFTRIKKGKVPDDIVPEAHGETAADDGGSLRQLEQSVRENRREVQTLRRDLRDTADLLQHLTEQNAKMVGEIDILRQRTKRLQRATAVIVLALLAVIVHAFLS